MLARDIQRGIREMERAMGPGGVAETFSWLNGANLPCVASSYGRRVEIDSKGNPVEVDLTLIVRRELLLTADSTLVGSDSDLFTSDNETPTPVSGKEIQFRGLRLKIVTVRLSGPQSHFELLVKDENV